MSEAEPGIQPAQIRNYNPETDFPSVRQNLQEGNLFWEEWDGEEKLRKRSQKKPDSVVVAVIDNQVVGNVFLVDDIYPYVFRLAVRKEFRRKGVGQQLMEEAMKRLKEHGHDEIAVFVEDDNEELKDWYKKLGFTAEGAYRSMWRKI